MTFGPSFASLQAPQEVEGPARRGRVVATEPLQHAGGASVAMALAARRNRRVVTAGVAAVLAWFHHGSYVGAEPGQGSEVVTLGAEG